MPHCARCNGRCHPTETAKDVLTWAERPSTPDAIKAGYQHYARQEPGTISKRYVAARDSVPPGPYGMKSKGTTESAAACFKTIPESMMARVQQELAEEAYARWARQLGATPERAERGRLGGLDCLPHQRPAAARPPWHRR